MKRAILLGVAILCLGGMVMAADVIIDVDGSISGDYSTDYVHIGVNAAGAVNVNANADLQVDNLAVTDTTGTAMGNFTIDAGVTVDVGGYARLGVGGMGTINVEGTLNVTGHFDYDGNASLSGSPGVYGVLNVSGSGTINGGAHMIFGGYAGGHPWTVTMTGNALINAGDKPLYIGGPAGSATCHMSGTATMQNIDGISGLYDNVLNIGWNDADPENPAPLPGLLSVHETNTVVFRHIDVKQYGTVEYILDAAGQACVLTSTRPADVIAKKIAEPEYCDDSFMNFIPGSIIDLDVSGVAAGILVPDFTVDLATADKDNELRWDIPGTYGVSLAADDIAAGWGLRRKPGDATTLQAWIIPEPTTMALLGLGGLLVAMRRKK